MTDIRAEVGMKIKVGQSLALGADGKIKYMPYVLSNPPGPFAPIALEPGDIVTYDRITGELSSVMRGEEEIYHARKLEAGDGEKDQAS